MKHRLIRAGAAALLAVLMMSGCAIIGGGVYEPQLMEGTVTRGALAQQILSQGSVSAQQVITVKSPYKFVMGSYLVSEGQAVTPDTVICEIPADQIADSLTDIRKKILDKKLEIATAGSSRTYYSYKAPAAGRVKDIRVKKGDDVEAVMAEVGYVALISTEARMMVLIDAGSLQPDDAVRVTVAGRGYDGTVTAVDAQGALVSIASDTPAVGAEAVVRDGDGSELGRGPLALASYRIVDAVMGEVTSVSVKENATVDMGATIVVASKVSGELTTKYNELAELEAEEQELVAMEGGAPITAGISGIVMSLPAQSGAEVPEDAPVATLAQPQAMIVATQVDELDIMSVYLGQKARVEVAALPGTHYEGTVTYISSKATISENDYTATPTFKVHIDLTDKQGLSMGMSVLAYLIIEEREDVLQVPVGALTADENGSLAVRVPDPGAKANPNSINPPYILVPVTVGMKNTQYAEVLSGLEEGQAILYDPSASDMPYWNGGIVYEGEKGVVEPMPVEEDVPQDDPAVSGIAD